MTDGVSETLASGMGAGDASWASGLSGLSEVSGISAVVGAGGEGSSVGAGASGAGLGCEMCADYELRLQRLQEEEAAARRKLGELEQLEGRWRDDLASERQYRTDLETKMGTLSRDAQERIGFLNDRLIQLEGRSGSEAEVAVAEKVSALEAAFASVSLEREQWALEVGRLRREYERVLGRQREEAAALQSAPIELPADLEGLQLRALQLREELIETRAAREHVEDGLRAEILALREEVAAEKEAKARQMADHQTTIGDLETKMSSLGTEKGEMEFSLREARKGLSRLQTELDNSEAVQRDFVKLSQNLQVELEKIRQAETEVRWEEAAEVALCGGCRAALPRPKDKANCRHCGKVHCADCLSQTVPSGPSRRPAPVCRLCHTLLSRHAKPYFSDTAPSHSSKSS